VIRWRLHVPAPPEAVYDALATDAGRASFWAESAIERDGHVHFVFANGQELRARIVERSRPRRFALEYFEGVATFTLSPSPPGGTDLLLEHEGVAPAEWADVHAGWLNVLLPLKARVAFGVDLRNHDPARTWDQGYVDQ
jgi:uncharacterized protein YndB with AHSA1/START domain